MPDPVIWTQPPFLYVSALALGYLLGSIPFGFVATRTAGLGDVRKIGSGNIGATNVLRTGRKGLAAATLGADALKGTAAAWAGLHWGLDVGLVSGLGAFLGHLFPVWLGFRGGKGVATYIGVLFGLYWPAGLVFCGLWLGTALAFRYSSLAALAAGALTPLGLAWLGQWPVAALSLVMSALLFVRHGGNIKRLIRGEEPRIGGSK